MEVYRHGQGFRKREGMRRMFERVSPESVGIPSEKVLLEIGFSKESYVLKEPGGCAIGTVVKQ